MDFAEWLQKQVDERDWTLGQAEQYTGIAKSMLSRYLARQSEPTPRTLKRLAAAFNVTPEFLLGLLPQTRAPSPSREPRTTEELARELLSALERERMGAPILVPETPPASAGPGAEAEAQFWPYIPTPEERGHKFVAVPVVGDCLEPRLRPGETVIVDENASPRPGDIVLANHDGEAVLKILERKNGDLFLIAIQNRPPIKVGEKTQIVGVVKFVQRRP